MKFYLWGWKPIHGDSRRYLESPSSSWDQRRGIDGGSFLESRIAGSDDSLCQLQQCGSHPERLQYPMGRRTARVDSPWIQRVPGTPHVCSVSGCGGCPYPRRRSGPQQRRMLQQWVERIVQLHLLCSPPWNPVLHPDDTPRFDAPLDPQSITVKQQI